MLPKTSTYVKTYDEQIKQMYFLMEDDELMIMMMLIMNNELELVTLLFQKIKDIISQTGSAHKKA